MALCLMHHCWGGPYEVNCLEGPSPGSPLGTGVEGQEAMDVPVAVQWW
jgi:hypothetical protein